MPRSRTASARSRLARAASAAPGTSYKAPSARPGPRLPPLVGALGRLEVVAAHVPVVLVPVAAGDLVNLGQLSVLDAAAAARPRESAVSTDLGEFARRPVGHDFGLGRHHTTS